MSRFWSCSEKITFFDVDVLVKNKSNAGSIVCTRIYKDDTRHHNGQNLLWTHSTVPRESTTFRPVVVVDKSTDNAK